VTSEETKTKSKTERSLLHCASLFAVIHTTVARGKPRQARRTFVSALMIDHVGSSLRQRRDVDMDASGVIHKSSLSSASLDVTAAAAARAPSSHQIWELEIEAKTITRNLFRWMGCFLPSLPSLSYLSCPFHSFPFPSLSPFSDWLFKSN